MSEAREILEKLVEDNDPQGRNLDQVIADGDDYLEQVRGMHEMVEDYVQHWLGEKSLAEYLHREIDNQSDRSWLYEEFIEYLNNK